MYHGGFRPGDPWIWDEIDGVVPHRPPLMVAPRRPKLPTFLTRTPDGKPASEPDDPKSVAETESRKTFWIAFLVVQIFLTVVRLWAPPTPPRPSIPAYSPYEAPLPTTRPLR